MDAATDLDRDVLEKAPAVTLGYRQKPPERTVPPLKNTDPAQLKQVTKVLRFLRDDIARANSSVNLPSTWILKSLIYSCGNLHYQSQSWLQDISNVLDTLTEKSQHELNGVSQFYDVNSDALLFPNNENFTATDLVLFLYRLKLHLAQIENEFT